MMLARRRRPRRATIAALAAFAALTGACSALEPITPNECGNGVKEAPEACDLFVEREGENLHCAQPDEPNPCRYVCADGAKCPDGWGCGDDQACRAASGTFDPAIGTPIALPLESFTFGDVDGDGLDDVVGAAGQSVTVVYAAREGGFPDHLEIQAPGRQGDASVALLDRDTLADIPIAIYNGILVSGGRRDRTFGPIAYAQEDLANLASGQPGVARVIPIRTARSTPVHEQLRLVTQPGVINLGLSFYLYPSTDAFPSDPSKQVDQLAGRIAVADLDADGDDEIALAFRDDATVTVFTSTCSAMFADCSMQPYGDPILFDGPISDDGVAFADVDGDGNLDLYGAITDNTGTSLARGTPGGGLSTSATLDMRFDKVSSLAGRLPLAAGDLDGDGKAEFIDDEGVWYSIDVFETMFCGIDPSCLPLTSPAHAAVIDDFNRDGIKDFAVALSTSAGADLYLGTGQGLFNPHHISTAGVISFLRSGDFDGDLVSDLAMVEGSPNSAGMRISIVYGSIDGGPSAPVVMAAIDDIRRVEVGYVKERDLISDLIVESSNTTDQVRERPLSVFTGTGVRRMVSPFALTQPGTQFSDWPHNLYAGRFLGDDTQIDLVATLYGGDLWIVEGKGSAVFERSGAKYFGPDVFAMGECAETVSFCPYYYAAGEDGRLIGLSPCDPERLRILRFEGSGPGITMSCRVLRLDQRVLRVSPQLGDIDDDGKVDLLLTHRETGFGPFVGMEATVPPPPVIPTAAAVLWGNDSELGFSTAPTFVDAIGYGGGAGTLLNADADSQLEIAVDGPGGIFIVNFDAARNPTLAAEPAIKFDGIPSTIVAKDIDHDGLDDLSFSDRSQLYIFHAVSQEELPMLQEP